MRTVLVVLVILISAVLTFGHRPSVKQPFEIRISAESQSVKVGSSAMISVRLTNNSNRSLDLSGTFYDLTGQDSNFIFEVRDQRGRMVAKRTYPHAELAGGKAILGRVVNPGGTLTENQDVARIYDMTRPGKYTVQVSRPVSFTDKNAQVVKSNEITITVIR